MKDKKVTYLHTYIIFIGCISFIGICILFHISLFYAFFTSIIFSSILLMLNGFSLKSLIDMMRRGIKECTSIFMILCLIGAIISIWLASGTVPTMIYYGFEYIKDTNFLLASFLISSIISNAMGTACGTISTMGVVLFGIGKGMGIPVHILLGAIVSGAFIGDKVSPVSGLVNLTMKVTGVQYKHAIKPIFRTFIPTFVLTCIVYYILGRNYTTHVNLSNLSVYQENIKASFFISPWLLLFPIILILFAIIGVKIIPNMAFALISGIITSCFLQNMSFNEVIRVAFLGYKASTKIDALNEILTGGGIITMVEVVLIIIGAVALSSIFEGTNLINPIINRILSTVKNKGDLVTRTVFLSSMLTIVTCDQTVGILLPGKLLQDKYNEIGINKSILARSIADSGTTIAPLTPWNINAIIIFAITGIGAVSYGPYAVLCYISPIITILFSCIKFTDTGNKKVLKSLNE